MPYAFNRRDNTEREIIAALFAIGAYVVPMQREDGWDLTVFYDGQVFIAEIKSPGGTLTPNEKTRQFHIEENGCQYFIWRSAEDALFDVMGAM